MCVKKDCFGRQNIYYKKQLRWTKCVLEKVAQVDKMFIIKSSLGEFRWVKHKLLKIT